MRTNGSRGWTKPPLLLEPVVQGVPGDRDVPVEVGIGKLRAGEKRRAGARSHILAGNA